MGQNGKITILYVSNNYKSRPAIGNDKQLNALLTLQENLYVFNE